jgi:hypothetical protein
MLAERICHHLIHVHSNSFHDFPYEILLKENG